MSDSEAKQARASLQRAADDLLEGRVQGPLTGIRLVELAGVKRHRLTHDNADLNAAFQERARALNRTKPEVDQLRSRLKEETARNARLTAERIELVERVKRYAAALALVLDERDRLREAVNDEQGVVTIPRFR
jgi:cell division protein FtsB